MSSLGSNSHQFWVWVGVEPVDDVVKRRAVGKRGRGHAQTEVPLLGAVGKKADDGFDFQKRRHRLERQQIDVRRLFQRVQASTVEFLQCSHGNGTVIARIFLAVCEKCAIWPNGSGDLHPRPTRARFGRIATQLNGSGVHRARIKSLLPQVVVAQLVGGCEQDVNSTGHIVRVHLPNLVRHLNKRPARPQAARHVDSALLKLCSKGPVKK
ncbi:hypothetical protein OGAPHI_003051 [Ogataea philodendri]|uniref:Uncharacterized protein n=1 Tax=Ogataea philodendri TaxID=1378263 RepID=A0A9P8P8T3_9ASCO|nr:uncharacterized protein OGAPHI_003051 [Ogataea philodendri]KAH3667402.1 hypothetical protein OGAPHI_003051 [Ogataea philodendri]